MLNKRSFFLGLGSGIIIGALLLELFYLGQSSQNKLNEIGQQIEQGGEQNSQNAETTDGTATSVSDASASPEPTPVSPANTPEPTKAPEQTPDQTKQPTMGEQHLIRIEPGFNLTQTGNLLVENGILEKATPFIKQMNASKKLVRAGYFLISEGISVEQAIKVVTGPPLSQEEAEKYARP